MLCVLHCSLLALLHVVSMLSPAWRDGELCPALDVWMQCCAQAMLQISASDPDEGCRAAAHRALADAPVSAASLSNVLSMEPSAPARTPAKKARAAAHSAAGAGNSLDDCIAVLELLQWKANVQDGVQLAGSLSSLLPRLLAISEEAAPAEASEDAASRWVAATQLTLSQSNSRLSAYCMSG